jgi:hypothetical protein
VPARRLARLGLPVHPAPAPHDLLHVRGGARVPHREQPGLRLRRGHAGQGADLGIRQHAAGQGLGETGQRRERARDPDPLPGRAQIQTHPPGEPVGAGAKARVPSPARVELPDQGEQARGRRVEVGGQLRNLVAEAVQLRGVSGVGSTTGESISMASPPSYRARCRARIEPTLHPGFGDAGDRPGGAIGGGMASRSSGAKRSTEGQRDPLERHLSKTAGSWPTRRVEAVKWKCVEGHPS